MPLPTQAEKDLLHKNYEDAIAALVDALVGQKVPRGSYGQSHYQAALTIAELVDAVVGENVARGPHGEHVYEAARNVSECHSAARAAYDYKLTDVEEYKAEVARRRQIGMTINPATAKTTEGLSDIYDPYQILDEKHHAGQRRWEQFACNPGGEWVNFRDLPEATSEALWERDWRRFDMSGLPWLDPDESSYQRGKLLAQEKAFVVIGTAANSH